MWIVLNEILRALIYLFIVGIICFAWKIACDSAKGGKYKTVLWKGLLWCAGISLFMSLKLGDPTCIYSENDPWGSECIEYADDGYKPTTEQRGASFAYYMTLLYVPVALGAFSKR